MQRKASRAIAGLTAFAVAMAAVPVDVFAAAGAANMTKADYEACQTREEASFRSAIEAITLKALSTGIAGLDYNVLVNDQWREGNLDHILDTRVDIAVGEVRDETSWGALIKSLASKEKAQELATAVAERVYRSDAMKTAIEGLAVGVAKDLGRHLELASVDATEPALTCLQAFLGPRYGSAVARFVTDDAESQLALGADHGAVEVTSGDVLKQSGSGLAGAAVLVLRRQMANLARRLGQRIVGSVLSRLVSVAAGGVGLVLIAKDIWDLRHGVLPIIADEMKSQATKDKVREELASVLAEQVREHVKEIAAKSAEHVVEVWQTFRRAHAKALELAESNENFKSYLNGLSAAQLPRLDQVVALILPREGEAGVLRRLVDGTLDQGVVRMPAAALEIAQTSGSLDTGLKWQSVAGEQIGAVVAHEIHQRARPEDFTSASLMRLLSIGDRLAITRLASVTRGARDSLFDLDPGELKTLARSLTDTELETLASYLSGLAKLPRERVLKAVAGEPGTMQLIASERVRRAVTQSRDQMAAVEMMLRPQGVLDPVAAYEDMQRAIDGKVSPILVWEKHPAAVVILAVLALMVIAFLRRLLSPSRARRNRRSETSAPTPPATGSGGATSQA